MSETEKKRERPSTDWVLEHLVTTVNRVKNAGINVTLVVPGAVITGTLIGFYEYYVEYGKVWMELTPGDTGKAIERNWREFAEKGFAELETKEPNFDPPHYIHVKDARLASVEGVAPPAPHLGFLWRGRISEVSGFAIGSLGGKGQAFHGVK